MKLTKKLLALGLAGAMVLSLAACGGNGGSGSSEAGASQPAGNEGSSAPAASSDDNGGSANTGASTGKNEEITIGSWWVQYYDSDDALEDASDWTTNQDKEGDDEATLETKAFNREISMMKFNNVPKIEEKYGVKFYWNNLTYEGVKTSINTSILAGTPDCDIYLVDTGMAIPAQINGLALDLKTVLPADDDLFTDQNIISFVDLGDGKACILKRVEAQSLVEATYPLGFNMQMLEENNLEDPRELYKRGEWTWDKFIEYCNTLTQDTDGDGQVDQYGYCGYEYETFEQLMMSNGATIAEGTTETLTSPEVGEALDMFYKMYNEYTFCYPYDMDSATNSTTMRTQYRQGNIGFFPIAAWIASDGADYDYDGSTGTTLPFDTAYVRWPVGPSGNQETNAGKNGAAGEYYIIPNGVQDPETVYHVLYDYWNWFDGDTTIRDDKKALNWWYGVTAKTPELQEQNFEVMRDCGSITNMDLWNSMGIEYDLNAIVRGEMTAAQFQETYKQEVQAHLDSYFK